MDEEFETYEDDLETHERDQIARDMEGADDYGDYAIDAAEDAAEWRRNQDDYD